ncbi:hypothetical protein CGZ80_18100 [Rhodopirellula sp. MGV]|nr:hypothetical protein CGZ80_18100 [Rhodopirellula sp. MGV]
MKTGATGLIDANFGTTGNGFGPPPGKNLRSPHPAVAWDQYTGIPNHDLAFPITITQKNGAFEFGVSLQGMATG